MSSPTDTTQTTLGLEESLAFARRYGLPVAPFAFVKTEEEVVKAALSMPTPWVLKGVAPEASHKTERGLVKVNLKTEADLRAAMKAMQERNRDLTLTWSVNHMVFGVEFIVGSVKDPSYGHLIAFGGGGITVELYQDVVWRAVPLSEKDADQMLDSVKSSVYYAPDGFRGQKANRQALKKVLLETSRLLLEHPEVTELDFNPVFCDEKQAYLVDARLVVNQR